LTVPFVDTLAKEGVHQETIKELGATLKTFEQGTDAFAAAAKKLSTIDTQKPAPGLLKATAESAPLADRSRDLAKQADHFFKLLNRLLDVCEKELNAKEHDAWKNRDIGKARKACDEARHSLVEQLREARYFHKQAAWLTERFPDATLVDVPGLVKLIDRKEIEKNDWSLTPGRYVGVAPEEVDEDFDFEESINDIHIELEGLNEEAIELAATISKNFKELMG
jgi:type I restriction enzyme M protein